VSNGGPRALDFCNRPAMEILVNGESRQVAPGETVLELLERLGLDPTRLALEVDGRILARTCWNERVLHPGARLEIVQFVGGG